MSAPPLVPDDLISIIVPVYNEQATIGAVIERLLTVDLPAGREIIVVDDGSSDGTAAVLSGIELARAEVRVVRLARNQGKGYAVRVGLAQTRGAVVAIQDADLELDPAEIGGLAEPVLRGDADAVYGSRFMNGVAGLPLVTRAGNLLLTRVTNLLFGSSLTDMETCYKIMRGDVARRLVLSANRFDIEPEITGRLILSGCRIVERPVTFSPRSRAAGKKIRWRDGLDAIRTLVRLRYGR